MAQADLLAMPLYRKDSPAGETGHFAPLDGLRGIAILLVLCIHAFKYQGASRVGQLLRELATFGWTGVVLFFVLSGFLITGTLIDTRRQRNALRDFYARRALRIFPLYFLFLVAYFYLAPTLPGAIGRMPQPHATTQVYYFAYLANMIEWLNPTAVGVTALGPLWSLSVEEQVYLIWPLAIWLVPPRRLGMAFGMVMVGSLGWRVGCQLSGFSITTTYAFAPSACEAFAAGGMVAWLLRQQEGADRLARWAPALAWISAVGLGLMVLALGHLRFWLAPKVILTLGLSLLSTLFASTVALIVLGGAGSTWNRRLSARWLRGFGRYSYAIYLFHETIDVLIRPTLESPRLGLGSLGKFPHALASFIVVVALTYVCSWISWRVWEAPFLRLKRFFPTRGMSIRPGHRVPAPHRQSQATALDAPLLNESAQSRS